MKGISRLLNKKCKRFKHHIRNILQNDIANKYITPPPPPPHPPRLQPLDNKPLHSTYYAYSIQMSK